MALTHALSTNNYGVAKFIVATSLANGTHTTLASAMADAVSGDTIFLRDSVTENVTLTAGVNISSWIGGSLNTPTITGTLTMTTAGTCNISGIRLVTNSAALLAVTGSAASIVNLTDCYLNATNNNAITFSSSSSSAAININYCTGNLGSNTSFFAHSSAGLLVFYYSLFSNSGGAITASTCSAGNLTLVSSSCNFPITTSSTCVLSANCCLLGATNTTAVTIGGSVSIIILSQILSGSASAISVSSGSTLGLNQCVIGSSNTNAITGAGILTYSGLTFNSTSSKINTTTQVGGAIQGGQTQDPSTGFLGERIQSTASAVATTSTIAKTITSIALTPGIWDVSAIASSAATGGTAIMTVQLVNISTTDNTLSGTSGIEIFQTNTVAAGAGVLSGSVPSYRVTLTSNTTYYLVVLNFYTSTTCPTNGRISATRVG